MFEALRHAADWFCLRGEGYNFWSGIGSGSPLIALFIVQWKKHNCHVAWCPRLQWHTHPDHGHPVCKKHHPHDPSDL